MTTVELTSAIAGTVASGSPVRADDVEYPFETVEDLFQSGVDAHNLSHSDLLRGESFRKNALTEVFTRKGRSESWTTRPAYRSQNHTDIPGGALRFRLRSVADVHVFFTVAIERLNKLDKAWTAWEQYGGTKEHSKVRFQWACNGLWEGSDGEPGRHYLQAQTWLASETRIGSGAAAVRNWIDKVDVARGISFNWKIKAVDGIVPTTSVMPPAVAPEGNAKSRTISISPTGTTSSPGLGFGDRGRLQAGWHNIRHTMSWQRQIDGGDGREGDDEADTLIFGNTELIVVANYGMAEDAGTLLANDRDIGQRQQKRFPVRGPVSKPQKANE